MKVREFGRYLEDFKVGEVIKHDIGKTILESDNNLFSLLTMNHHPLHLNTEFCKYQVYGKILVVGTLVFSLVVGLTVRDISGKAIANLDYEKVTHDGPVFIGDTITAETEIFVDIGDSRPTRVKPIKRKMKRSSWHKYMKNSKNQIKFKRGSKKGLLDMKAMARNYKRSRK